MNRWDRRDAKRRQRGRHRHKEDGRSVLLLDRVERPARLSKRERARVKAAGKR